MNTRAFALPLVILVGLIATLAAAAALERQSAQRLMVQRQIDEYRRHHDMLGAKSVIRYWLSRQQDLTRLGADPARPAHRFALPGGLRVSVYLSDGQGTVKGDLSDEQLSDRRLAFEDLFYRLPPGRPDLVRRTGPPEVCVNSAPREVLAALRADDASLASAIMSERDRRRLDAGTFRAVLDKAGVRADEIGELMKLVVYEPSLWKITVDAVQGEETRRFAALVEPRQNDPVLHEWRELRQSADGESAAERSIRRSRDQRSSF